MSVVLHVIGDLWIVPTYVVERRIVKVQGLTPSIRIFIALLQLFQLRQAWVLRSSEAWDWSGSLSTSISIRFH